MIQTAFGVRDMQVVAPASMRSERYDISAKLPAGTSKEQFQMMLQNFLKERFNLTLHHEERTLPVHALTVGKNGPKLKESSSASTATSTGRRIDDEGFPVPPADYVGVMAIPSNGRLRMTGQKAEVDQLARVLQDRLDHPIVDQTGLAGKYDFKVEIEWIRRPDAAAGGASDPAPSVSQALEKLGLKLELKRLPFDVLIIDRIDKFPTEN